MTAQTPVWQAYGPEPSHGHPVAPAPPRTHTESSCGAHAPFRRRRQPALVISVLDRRVLVRGRTPDRHSLWVSARSVGDPLLVGLVALVVYALHGRQGYLEHDLGVFVYGGEHVARGVPPYTGIFNSVGPLADAVPGLAIWLGRLVGVAPVPAARLFFLMLSVACVVLVQVLARDSYRSRAAGFVAAAAFLTFTHFIVLATDGPREKTTMVLALLGCLVLLGRRRFLAAGVCTALATLTWQPALAPAVAAAAAVVLLLPRGERVRAAVAFVAGGAVPSALAVAWFALTRTLHAAVGGFLLINLRDARQPSPILAPTTLLPLLWRSYGLTLLLVPLGVVGLVLLALRDRRLWGVAAGGLAATAWSAAVLNGAPDLFVVLPFAALGVAGLVVRGAHRLPLRLRYGVLVAVVGGAVVAATVESIATRSDLLVLEQADIRAVLATQPADATVLSIDAPQVLALSGRDNPTAYQLFNGTMRRYLAQTLPGGMRGYARQIAALQPTFVVTDESHRGGAWPDRVLATDYWRVGDGPGWTWYLDRAAGPAALARARAANESRMQALPPGKNRFGADPAPGQSAGA
jgi:hypothetical protein